MGVAKRWVTKVISKSLSAEACVCSEVKQVSRRRRPPYAHTPLRARSE